MRKVRHAPVYSWGLLPSYAGALAAAMLIAWPEIPVSAQGTAPEVVYHGVHLRVDDRLSAGGDLLKIVLLGEAFLVSASDAPRQVVLRYLNHADEKPPVQPPVQLQMSSEELRAIALTAVQQRDPEVLRAAVVVGVTSQQAEAFSSDDLWRQLASDPEMRTNLWQAVEGVRDHAVFMRVCRAGAALERAERAQHAVTPDAAARGYVSVELAQRCLRQASRTALEGIFAGRDAAQILVELKEESKSFVGQGVPPENGLNVASVESGVAALMQALREIDPKQFEEALHALTAASSTIDVPGDVVPVRRMFVAQAIAKSEWRPALEQLTRIPFESRSPTTHAQLIAALRGLSTDDWATVLDPQIRPVLVRYVAKDEEFYSQWIATHRRMITELVRAKSVDDAQRLAIALQQEDPAVAQRVMPEVAHAVVQGYLDRRDLPHAEEALRVLSVKPSVALTMRLFVARWGLSATQTVGIVTLWGAIVAIIVRVSRRQARTTVGTEQSKTTPPGEELLQRHTDPVVERVPLSEEYIEALRHFGLEPGATRAQIKNAYRAAVKQYHPDRQRVSSTDNATLFIRLTAEYEKLLELHEQEGSET
jgi:hypothetical protein